MVTFDMDTPMIERHRNLRTLMHFLEDLPHSKFHMPVWSSGDATETSCGTAGCAAGWAATIFHQKGFRLSKDSNKIFGRFPILSTGVLTVSDAFAFSVFFGISNEQAAHITSGFLGYTGYMYEYGLVSPREITPQMVADRIRNLLKQIDPDVLTEKYEITPKEALLCPAESH